MLAASTSFSAGRRFSNRTAPAGSSACCLDWRARRRVDFVGLRFTGPIHPSADPDAWIQAHHAAGYTANRRAPHLDPKIQDWTITWPPQNAQACRSRKLARGAIRSVPTPRRLPRRSKNAAPPWPKRSASERAAASTSPARAARCGMGPIPRISVRTRSTMIVRSVRSIIDTVAPTRTVYALETMPWIFPDSPDSYLALLRAVRSEAIRRASGSGEHDQLPGKGVSNGRIFYANVLPNSARHIVTCPCEGHSLRGASHVASG